MRPAAIGFRVKSGWAAAVLLGGPVASPVVLDSRNILLSDPDEPASRQPYHAGTGSGQTDAARIKKLTDVVQRSARRSVADLVKDYRCGGTDLRGAALVVGSDVDPARIANPHIRAHASEGRLFCTALEEALARCELARTVVVERGIFAQASQTLGRAEPELKAAVTTLGRAVAGGWRAEQKTAALGAWTLLASGPRGGHL